MATTKIAVTVPNPRASRRPTVHLKLLPGMMLSLRCVAGPRTAPPGARFVESSSGRRSPGLTRARCAGRLAARPRLTGFSGPRTRDGPPTWTARQVLRVSCGGCLQAELPDEALELLRGAGELLGRRGDLLRRGARLLRGGRDLLRGGRGLLGDRGDLGHVAPDLLRARRDLLDRCGDLLDPAVHVLDGRAERQERLARLLDRGDAVLGLAGAVLDDLDGLGPLRLALSRRPRHPGGRPLG